jgi:hypothetical protein
VRLKISNNGRSTAHNVRLMIISISNNSVQALDWNFQNEVIDCGWAHIEERKVNIPRKTWRFADIFYLDRIDGNAVLKFADKAGDRVPGNIEKITFTVLVSADNCDTIEATVPLRYRGTEGMVFEKTP